MAQGILLNGRERRRKWHESQRREIVSLAFSPGSSVTEVARQFDVATSMIYIWRRQLRAADPGVSFSPAVVADRPDKPGPSAGLIIIDFRIGARVSVSAGAPVELVSVIMKSLR